MMMSFYNWICLNITEKSKVININLVESSINQMTERLSGLFYWR
jgi:hypothetical protein